MEDLAKELKLDMDVEVLEERIAPSLVPLTLVINPTGGRAIRILDVSVRENAVSGIRYAIATSPALGFDIKG